MKGRNQPMEVLRTSQSCKTLGSSIDSYGMYDMCDKVGENIWQQCLPLNVTIEGVWDTAMVLENFHTSFYSSCPSFAELDMKVVNIGLGLKSSWGGLAN